MKGLDMFRRYFSAYQDQYVLIGGAACDILFEQAKAPFRATKDVDMVLVVESLTPEFGRQFWRFIQDGGYEHRAKSNGSPQFYRFDKPKTTGFPYMIELFSRIPGVLHGELEGPCTPMPLGEEISSLSAILLDEDYYRALLKRLTLAPDHRENLLRRGLTDEAIDRLGYKTTPVVGFHALAQSLLDEGYTLFGVPGFYRDEDGRWTMAVWRRGILIPGTYFGKIQGFQIRLDHKMKKGGKFLTFSSRDELDGAMGENWCHLVGPVRERILLIEGYMKADIVHHFTGQTMLAIPGVTSLQHLESALKDLIPLGVRHVMTCFDMDYLKNWHVENAYRNLVSLLGKLDITFGTYLWVPDHNGLDDYIWEFCLNEGKPPE